MAEYIERDAALDVIEEMQRALCPVGRFGRGYVYGSDREAYDAWQEILDSISAIHAAEVAPVVHGHVIVNWLGDCHCSGCGKSIDSTSRYCNWCGAILDEPEQKEE